MKKIIFFFTFFFCFFFLLKIEALAYTNCQQRPIMEKSCNYPFSDPSYQQECKITGFAYCCKTTADCQKAQSQKPTTNQPTTAPSCEDGAQNINTAIGPINVCDINSFTGSILKLGIGLGGGIAFLLMLVAVFLIMTSAGDPKRMQAGQELITSALMGLLLIIFSVFLLQFIGMDILKIPGFGK